MPACPFNLRIPSPTETESSTATESPAATLLPTPTETTLPSATPTLEPGLPAADPPVVSPGTVISPENASQVVELAGWGEGYDFNLFLGMSQLDASGKLLVQAEIAAPAETFSGGIVRTRFWDLPSGQLRLELIHPDGYDFFTVSPDGTRFAIFQNYCHRENPQPCQIEVWSFPENERLLSIETEYNLGAAFSPDSRLLAIGTVDDIALWDLEEGTLLHTLPDSFRFDRFEFSPDGNLVAGFQYLGDGTVHLWQVETAELVETLTYPTLMAQSPEGLEFSPGGSELLLAYGGSVVVWKGPDWSAGPVWEFGQRRGITTLTYSPDGRLVASGRTDGSIVLADAASGEVLAVWDAHTDETYDYITNLAFTPDGTLLVTVSMDYTLRFWGIKE
jgi:WD40 repeat protein